MRQLQKYYDVGLTYTSDAIEGNTLTAVETTLVIEKGITVSGKPLKEPVAWRGPIVMNTQAELRQAMDELHSGKFIRHK